MRERRAGVWELRVFLGEDPVTKKERYKSVTVRGTRRDAETQLAKMVGKVQDTRIGRNTTPNTVTLSQLVTAHIAALDAAPGTLASYRSIQSNHIDPTIGRMTIDRLDTLTLDRFYAYLGDRGLNPNTVRRVHAVVRGALRQAQRWGWINRNPATDALLPRMEKYEPVLPTAGQVGDVIEAAYDHEPEFGMFVQLAAATGARRGELCGLRWLDVDLDGGIVRIEANLVKTHGGTVLKDTKNHTKRNVPLDTVTFEALVEHRQRMEERAAACRATIVADGYVFSHAHDSAEPRYPDNVSSKWALVRDKAGLGPVRLHDLRHFQATALLAAGVPVKNVSKRIGHRDAATTLNVYAHALEELDRHSADVIGQVLARPPRRGATSTPENPATPHPEP